MKKQTIILFGLTLLSVMLFSACTVASEKNSDPVPLAESAVGSSEPGEQPEGDPLSYDADAIMYSNLTDTASQKEVYRILQKHGITSEQTDTLKEWIDDFNKRVETPLSQGFEKMTGPEVNYSTIVFEQKETKDGSYLPEANCRLTAFLLMRHYIHTNGKRDEKDTYLLFDMEAIDAAGQFQLDKESRSNYYSLYNWISVDKLKTVEEHTEAIQKVWKERGIQIDSTKGVTLINVYMHSTFENVRIVGHTGVLLDLDDKLLFVEKYGPAAPFQATWFHNRAELKKYLLAREDLYGDEEELPPIIMENNQVMKTA